MREIIEVPTSQRSASVRIRESRGEVRENSPAPRAECRDLTSCFIFHIAMFASSASDILTDLVQKLDEVRKLSNKLVSPSYFLTRLLRCRG